MNLVFYSVLVWTSEVTRLSYEKINIVVYYILIPAAFFFVLDRICRWHLCKLVFAGLVLVFRFFVPGFSDFSDHLFELLVDFLLCFSVIGWNYTVASVIICVLVPLLAFVPLVNFAFPALLRRSFPAVAKPCGRRSVFPA